MSSTQSLTYERLQLHLAPRARDTHKGDYGHVLVAGGDLGTGGAVLMAAEAAARSGAGLTSVLTRPEHVSSGLQRCPELMLHGMAEDAWSEAEMDDSLKALSQRATVIVLGPGLGRSTWSRDCMLWALGTADARSLPVVIDADALNMLSSEPALGDHYRHDKWILTPHAGEAARLLGTSRAEVEDDRHSAVIALQQKFGGIAILKGPGTLVSYRHDARPHVAVCTHGNPGMASGGMGDVLSGVLGGLLAQRFSLHDSVLLGVTIHGKAADLAADKDGERGMLATDLLPWIRRLLNP